ncbi:hypothetical protein [Streptomyces sp. NPDC057302]|uniref:hypothetical protein n=1 Tax=Streptomyces sp. NPDC057302 TaxID=3346094 RepID=UPI003633E1B2
MGTDPLAHLPATNDAPQTPDKHEPGADQRRRGADERDTVADERESIADQREAAADQREAAANAWQDHLASHEKELDVRLRAAGEVTPSRQQRSFERIDQAQSLLRASHERLDRSLAALRRSDATELREQRAIDQETELSTTQMAAQGPEALKALKTRASRLREQASAAAEALATAEDALAHEHEKHHRPQQAAEHRHHAAQARTAFSVLRAITEPPDGDDDGTTLLPRSPA